MIPIVVRDTTDQISIRAIHPHTGAELSLTSGTVAIYQDNGTQIVAATAVSVSTSKATYSQSWPEATYPITIPPRYYRAEWSLLSGGTTYSFTSYFEVASRRFRRPVGETDFSAKYPYLSTIIPTGASLSSYLTTAWSKIGDWLYARLGGYPGNMLYPEQLSTALELMTVADIHQAVSLGPNTEDDAKAKQYMAQAIEALERSLSLARIADTDDKDSNLNSYAVLAGPRLVR